MEKEITVDRYETLEKLISNLTRVFEANNETQHLTAVMPMITELLACIRDCRDELDAHQNRLIDLDLVVSSMLTETDQLQGAVDGLLYEERRKNN